MNLKNKLQITSDIIEPENIEKEIDFKKELQITSDIIEPKNTEEQIDLYDIEKENNELQTIMKNFKSDKNMRDKLKTKNDNINNFVDFNKLIFGIIITFPIIICDLYYGYNDNTCVNERSNELIINLKDYLLVSGWVNVFLNVIFILYFWLTKTIIFKKFKYLNLLIQIYSIIWTSIGCIIFWKLIDNNKCSKGVYNYVFITLIINLLAIFFNIINLFC